MANTGYNFIFKILKKLGTLSFKFKFKFLTSTVTRCFTDLVQLWGAFLFFFFYCYFLLFFFTYPTLYSSSSFVGKEDMKYDSGCKFTIQDSEIHIYISFGVCLHILHSDPKQSAGEWYFDFKLSAQILYWS